MAKRGRPTSRVIERYPNNIKRLRDARGLSLARLAERMGSDWYPQKIAGRERGDTRLSVEEAQVFAGALGVDASEVYASRLVAVAGYVGAGAEIVPFDDHAVGEGIDQVKCPAGLDPERVVAVRVRGDSMFPIEDGWDLFYRKDVDGVPDDAIGRFCVVKLDDGRVFAKHLTRGSQPGTFTLLSSNAAPIQNVRLRWAARVLTMLPGDLGLAA